MKKMDKKVKILSPGRIFQLDLEKFFHSIFNKLEACRNTPVPGYNPRVNSPVLEAEFDLSIFVQTILDRNEDTAQAQIAIVCRGLHINLEELCQYLLADSASELRAKMIAEAHP